MTPVDFGKVTVVLTDIETGETLRQPALPTGKVGDFTASVTYPVGGWWSWHVEHDGLVIETPPTVVGIFAADGTPPQFEPGPMPQQVTAKLQRQLDDLGTQRDSLQQQVTTLTAAAATTQGRLADADGRPTLATVVVLVLAAGIASLLGGVALTLAFGRPARSRVRELSVRPAEAD